MLRLISLLLLLVPSLAFGQGAIQQQGPFTPGHIPMITGNGRVMDGGSANGGNVGTNPTEQSFTQPRNPTGPNRTNWCDYDAPATGPNHYLCLGPNPNGQGGILSYGANGGAATLPFSFNINGANFPITNFANAPTGSSPQAFGASITSTDNTAALQAAFSSGVQIFMDGMYKATGPIVVNACPSIRGWNSSQGGILFTGTSGGLTINCPATTGQSQTGHVDLYNFSVLTSASGGGTALTLTFGAQQTATTPLPSLNMQYVHVQGDTSSHYWSNGVVITNAQGANVLNNFVAGSQNNFSAMAAGITWQNTSNVDAQVAIIAGNYVLAAGTGFSMVSTSSGGGDVEGLVVRDNLFISVTTGMSFTASSLIPPSFLIEGNQTGASGQSLTLTNLAQVYVHSNTFYTTSTSGGPSIIVTNCNRVSIGFNEILGATASPVTGYAVQILDNSSIGDYTGNWVSNYADGLFLDNTTLAFTIQANNYGSAAITVTDQTNGSNYIGFDNGTFPAHVTFGATFVTFQNKAIFDNGFESIGGDTNGAMVLGAGRSNQPYVNFDSSQSGNSYDARIQSTAANTLKILLNTNAQNPMTFTQAVTSMGNAFQLTASSVASLPTCNSGSKGYMYLAVDATSPTYGATLVGSGSSIAIAVCDGTNWEAH